MNKEFKNKLAEKGWSRQEIKKTEYIIKKSKIKKSKKVIFLDKNVYWIALFVGVFGNIIISFALIPFLLALKGFQLYFVIIVLGMSFGLFFEIIIRDIENLETKHHVIATIVIPFLALINMYVITIVADELRVLLKISSAVNIPALIGFVYAVSFIMPYLLYQFILMKK